MVWFWVFGFLISRHRACYSELLPQHNITVMREQSRTPNGPIHVSKLVRIF